MRFQDDQNTMRSTRRDIKDDGSTSGSAWGLAIVVLVMIGILGLGVVISP